MTEFPEGEALRLILSPFPVHQREGRFGMGRLAEVAQRTGQRPHLPTSVVQMVCCSEFCSRGLCRVPGEQP